MPDLLEKSTDDAIPSRTNPLPELVVHLYRRPEDTRAIEEVQKKPRFENLQLIERREKETEETLPCLCIEGMEYRGLAVILQFLSTI